MKKLLLGLVICLLFGATTSVSAQSLLPQNLNSVEDLGRVVGNQLGGLSDLINIGASGTNEVRGIIGTGAGIVNDIEEIGCIIKGDCGVTPEGTFELPPPDQFNTIGENVSLRQYILNVLNFVLSFLGLIAVAALIYAGFLYVTSGGDDSANEKGKKILIYAVIGILLILASFAIVNTVIRNAGVGTDDRNNISNVDNTGGAITNPGTGSGVGGNNGLNSLQSRLVNPIIVTGEGVQDSINTAFVPLGNARNGVEFGLAVEALAIIDFGDNFQVVVDTKENPELTVSHAYGEAGQYTVTAIIETIDGQQAFFQKQLFIGNLEAKILGPQREVLVGAPIEVSADRSMTQQGTITKYEWSCENCNLSNPNESATEVTFTAPGSQKILLEITNSIGQTAQNATTYEVVGGEPTAQFSGRSTENQNRAGEFRFDASESQSIRGDNTGLTYNWKFDGLSRQTSNPEMIYTFTDPGSVNVELFVTQTFNGERLTSETVSQTFEVPSTLDVDFDVY